MSIVTVAGPRPTVSAVDQQEQNWRYMCDALSIVTAERNQFARECDRLRGIIETAHGAVTDSEVYPDERVGEAARVLSRGLKVKS